MTKTYDFSEYNVSNMVYHFAELSPAEGVLKKEEMEVLIAEEKAKKAITAKSTTEPTATAEKLDTATAPKPAFKPKVTIPAVKKSVTDNVPTENKETADTTPEVNAPAEPTAEKPVTPKPVFKPKVMIPAAKKPASEAPAEGEIPAPAVENAAEKSVEDTSAQANADVSSVKPKPVMKPIVKPVIPKKPEEGGETNT